MVSICCLAFNHEPYIRKCIEGFLMQKTCFSFEALIHDDASTDKTAEIIREYEVKYPKIIKPIYQSENQYSKGIRVSQIYQFPRSKGKYIAICEGDDYWTDPLKLQKQVDFLEKNEDYGLVYTGCETEIGGVIRPIQDTHKIQSGYIFSNLLMHDFFIPNLTVCVRKDLLLEWSKSIYEEGLKRNWKMGDYPLWLQGSLSTKFKYLPDNTAYYRILPESASHSRNIKKSFEFTMSVFDIKFYFIHKENVTLEIRKKILARFFRTLFNYSKFIKPDVVKGFFHFLKNNKLSFLEILKAVKIILSA